MSPIPGQPQTTAGASTDIIMDGRAVSTWRSGLEATCGKEAETMRLGNDMSPKRDWPQSDACGTSWPVRVHMWRRAMLTKLPVHGPYMGWFREETLYISSAIALAKFVEQSTVSAMCSGSAKR